MPAIEQSDRVGIKRATILAKWKENVNLHLNAEPWSQVSIDVLSDLILGITSIIKPEESHPLSDKVRQVCHTLFSEACEKEGISKRIMYGAARIVLSGKPDGLDVLDIIHIHQGAAIVDSLVWAWVCRA